MDQEMVLFGPGKQLQSPVENPVADGMASEFVDSISQDANGLISATRKGVHKAAFADNLDTDKMQYSDGEYIIRTSGGSASIQDGDAYLLRIMGNRVHTGYSAEQLECTVTNATREEGEEEITASIDRDTFISYAGGGGAVQITLSYTSAWSHDPADYGVTVNGTPKSGDSIEITFVAEDRGTITVANPTAFKSTGWNLYKHGGLTHLIKYSNQYSFRIGGTYTGIRCYKDSSGTGTNYLILPASGMFYIPYDEGWLEIVGGDETDTYIINAWSDWTEGPPGEFEPYSETGVDFSTVMSTYFPNGLMRVGAVRDEINLNTQMAVNRIERMTYSAVNLETAEASGRAYECDTNYIYIVKAAEETHAIVLEGAYTVSDHGNEFFEGTTDTPVYIETIYGNNLKNKLERDVVTISDDFYASEMPMSKTDSTKVSSAISTLNSKIASFIQTVDYGMVTVLNPIDLDEIFDARTLAWAGANLQYVSNPPYQEAGFFISFVAGDRIIHVVLNVNRVSYRFGRISTKQWYNSWCDIYYSQNL